MAQGRTSAWRPHSGGTTSDPSAAATEEAQHSGPGGPGGQGHASATLAAATAATGKSVQAINNLEKEEALPDRKTTD